MLRLLLAFLIFSACLLIVKSYRTVYHENHYKKVLSRRDTESDTVGMALLNQSRTMDRLARRLSKIDLSERLEKAEKVAADLQKREADRASDGVGPPAKRTKGSQF